MKAIEVTKFLRDLVEMTMIHEVDDKGYVIDEKTKERITLIEEGSRCPLILYQEEIKDQTAILLNPLAEGLGQTKSSLWLFKKLKVSLIGRIKVLWSEIITRAIADKKLVGKKEDKTKSSLPIDLLNIASHIIDNIDDTTLVELEQLFAGEDGQDVLTIDYQKRQLRHVVGSGIFITEETLGIKNLRVLHPKIRKKTWTVFERLLLDTLHISNKEEISKFNRTADGISCVRFSSLLNVILAIYQEINPLLALISNDVVVDLSMLVDHIKKLPLYAQKAQYMVTSPKSGNDSPTTTVIPGTVPTVPQPNSFIPQQQNNVSYVPGPTFSDGRQAPPIPVYTASGGVPGAIPTQPVYVPLQQPVVGFIPPVQQGLFPQQQYAQQNSLFPQPQGYMQQNGFFPQQQVVPPFNQPYNQIPVTTNMGFGVVPNMPPLNRWG